jgi:Ca2+/Na+ antiporter
VNIIIRKAAAATGSILNPLAMGLVLAGVVAWVVLFRRLLPTLRTQFTTLHTVAIATLAVAILGTALNDGGITIWYTVTLTFTVTVAALWIDRTCRPNVAHRAPQQGGFGRRLNAR